MSLFAELKRRNVIRVGVAYLIAAWLVLQIIDVVGPILGIPDWVPQTLLLLLGLGLVAALIIAWAYELTPDGIRRESRVDPDASITVQTGRKLNQITIGLLVAVLAVVATDRLIPESGTPAEPAPIVQDVAATPAEAAVTATGQKAGAVPPGDARESVAVLPFAAMSSGVDDEYFADGLTEEILNSLAALPELLVTARTSSFHFKGQNLPVQQIAATLGVGHVVEGSVRRAGERVRITAQLIRAGDGFHLWSDTYDRTLEDIFAVQEDIAEKIAETLDVVLSDDKRQAMRAAGIGNVAAFIAYQKGMDAYDRAHKTDWPQVLLVDATRWLDEALAIVPDIDRALYLRTDLYGHILLDHAIGLEEYPRDQLERAQAEIVDSLSRAARVARNASMRAILEAEAMIFTDDWSRIPAYLELAFETGHCNPVNWLAEFVEPYGYAAAYARLGEDTSRCDPMSGWPVYSSAWALIWDGQPERALELAEAYLERAPFHPWVDDARYGAKLALDPSVSDPAMFAPTPDGSNYGVPRAYFAHALRGDLDAAMKVHGQWALAAGTNDADALVAAAAVGNRSEANRLARLIDGRIGGMLAMSIVINGCRCGAPFDLDAAPNFKARLTRTGFHWPPPSPYNYPAKDW